MSTFTAADRAFFDENGYVVVPGAVPIHLCEAVIDTLFRYLGMDRNAPNDWYRQPLNPGGMIEIYQHQSLWDTRQHPNLHEIFASLIGTDELCVTIDRANFKPPADPDHPEYDHKGFIHWDVNTNCLPEDFGVQAVLCLADTDADMGGFQCIPGFHKNLNGWITTQPADRNPYVPNLEGLIVTPIPAKAGSIVIWNRNLAHGNGHNVSNRPRFSQYISMFRADHLKEECRKKRVYQWQNHCPPYNRVYPGDARRIEEAQGTSACLTQLGRKLLGIDWW